LSKLSVGDDIYIVDDEGNTITFVVNSTALYAANADATTLFTSSDGKAHLNLITCEGIWNEVAGEYPARTVVFTTEVSSAKRAAPATTLSASAFPRSLSIGDSGVDVSALQTALEQKGFLTMPASVATGYFGALTSAAVSAYQTSVGLSAVGIFGLMAFAVAQRTHEIGVRMALGAKRSDMVTLMVRSGLRLAVVGTAIGLAGALTLARLMQSTLYGVPTIDLVSLSAVAVLLLSVAVLACWVPARRSAGIDPMRVLRQE